MAAGDTMEYTVWGDLQTGMAGCGRQFAEHGLKELKGHLLDEHVALIQQEPLLGYGDRICFRAQREGDAFAHLHNAEVQVLINRSPDDPLRELWLRWVNEFGEHLKKAGFFR